MNIFIFHLLVCVCVCLSDITVTLKFSWLVSPKSVSSPA